MSENKIGNVYLVGAGCGKGDLITLRGLRLLETCDAVVYDDLIDHALLQAASKAEKYPAGKRCGRHSMPQEETNQLLVHLAKQGKNVVRLKGGDPFVFGRGGEEILALQEAGVLYEEVPGISSSIAIPAAAGIPVTHRELSRSFHVITGHTNKLGDELPESIEALAALDGTLVFLMGLSSLEKIAQRLMAAGKSPDTPAAVVSGGNAPHKATVRGTLQNIGEKTRQAQVQAPAVIVVGQVAALHMEPTVAYPLEGTKVGLLGTDSFVSKLEEGFGKLGAETQRILHGEVERLSMDYSLESLTDGKPKWIVLTSSNGVRCFFRWLREEKVDLRRLAACKFAVIGKSTGETLAEAGIQADLRPEIATGKAMAEMLCQKAQAEEEILLFRSRLSDDTVPGILRAQGLTVREYPLYDTSYTVQESPETMDYLIFGSAWAVKTYFENFGTIPEKTRVVAIGPVSAAQLKKHWDKPFLLAEEISVSGILETVRRDGTGKHSGE